MAKRKKIRANDVISLYMDYILEHNSQPKSIHAFSKASNFEEATFYESYDSFKALEKDIFKTFFDNSISVLHKSEDYKMYDSRNKLLSFYYTFFENLTANRTYIMHTLNKHKSSLKSIVILSSLRKSFMLYIIELEIETIDMKQDKLERIQQKAIQQSAWIQLLVTIKFWMGDTSSSFEKTDIFIEKSINTSFDLINIKPLKSVIDFGKFLFKEKMHKN